VKPIFSMRLVVLIVPMLLVAGCGDILPNSTSRLIKEGEEKYEAGHYREAIQFYERAIDGTVKTADIHYRLGLIYDDRLKSPLDALHHFGRYIELAPKGAYEKESRGRIKETELEAITMIARGAPLTQREGARLRNENLELRKQALELRSNNSELREQIKDLRKEKIAALKRAGVDTTKVTRKPIPEGARTYMVEPGDTLAAISRKFYKTSSRWKDIQDANFNTLEGTVRLKPGQVLIIPE
jgi:LysM repeat protein